MGVPGVLGFTQHPSNFCVHLHMAFFPCVSVSPLLPLLKTPGVGRRAHVYPGLTHEPRLKTAKILVFWGWGGPVQPRTLGICELRSWMGGLSLERRGVLEAK